MAPRLVVFDLDGTLLRGPTVCEVLAAPVGRSAEMAELEERRTVDDLRAARATMYSWYGDRPVDELRRWLDGATLAPGAVEGCARLRAAGCTLAACAALAPLAHAAPASAPAGTQAPAKEIDGLAIAEAAVLDMRQLHAEWYDWALGRGALPALLKDHVTYFMAGADEWRYAPALAAVSSGKDLVLHLAARTGTPLDLYHSGDLSAAVPGSEPPARLVSDPRELPELDVAREAADENLTSQFRGLQKRALVFHSAPFAHDVEMAGHMRLQLACAADQPVACRQLERHHDYDQWQQGRSIVLAQSGDVHDRPDRRMEECRQHHAPDRDS